MTASKNDGEAPRKPLELNESLTIETHGGNAMSFEVVGILEDSEAELSYAVLHHESDNGEKDEFIVTDLQGNLVEDGKLAQEILDDFLAFAEEQDPERAGGNGETH